MLIISKLQAPAHMLMVVTPTSRLLLFHLYATCCFLLSYHLPHHVAAGAVASPFSFSFDFTNRSSYSLDDLRFEGNATLDAGLVDLTCNSGGASNENCTGRMSYNHPVPFYDTTTVEVASFSTRFNFRISHPGEVPGDGMAFFLSSYPSMLPPNSAGGNLGLHSGDGMNAEGTNRIVAVEFDTYANKFDPSYDHIGIDINTVHASVNTTSVNGTMNGSMTATITFNSSTRMLVASLHFDDQPSRGSYQVSTQLTNPVKNLLPSEVAVGFSAATGLNFEVHQIMSWSFNSTLVRKDNRKLVIGGAIGSVVVGLVLVWFILSFYRWRRTHGSFVKEITGLKRLEYSVLAAATGKFSMVNALGEGAFGAIYRGIYTDENGKQEVAVKKIKKSTIGEARDFMAEIRTISVTRHPNLIELKGWCCSRNIWNLIDLMCWCRQQRVKLFLVYELVPNGTLEDHLHHMEETLTWEKRYEIVKGIGSALCYLHHECNRFILPHRDIKTSNILLDYDFKAKLADFALLMFASQSNATPLTNAIGTVGYMDPESMKDRDVEFKCKTDVYSFGIVLLEIACRKTRERVLEWNRSSAELWVVEAADEKLNGVFDKTQIERVIVLGLKCSDADWKQRPYMEDAMKFLEDGIDLPAITEIEGQHRARSLGTFTPAAALTSAIGLGATDPRKMNHESVPPPRRLSYDFLQEITGGFSKDRECGRGTYGVVYLGVNKDGEKIAVKVLHDMLSHDDNDEQFDKEFKTLACLQHPNIVRFVGYCHETHRDYVSYNGQMVLAYATKRALCFEYMHNGSLDKFISDKSNRHDWHTCYAMIKGICDGLNYLHEELQSPIFHLDLKPANILLDDDMVPKLADFGLSRFFGEERTQITQNFIGTIGYLPPEFIKQRVISNKYDIFSLGVVIIKIMTGPEGYSKCGEMPSHEFIELVHEYWSSRLHAKSACMLESYSKQLKRCMEIALSCVEADRQRRPSIGDIVSKLNETETMIHKTPNIGGYR